MLYEVITESRAIRMTKLLMRILNGRAMDTSMGLSPQSGLPQNNRVGDLDSMAVTYVMKTLGLTIEEVENQLTKQSGLLVV